MPAVTLPVTRPVGRTMLIAPPQGRANILKLLLDMGFQCSEMDDPYAAMAELCRRPLTYQSLVVCLSGIYREELAIIGAVKRRFQHIEVWLSGVDGRAAALAEAMRLGADGLVDQDGLHRIAVPGSIAPPPVSPAGIPPLPPAPASVPEPTVEPPDQSENEPVLTAEELRALLRS